MTDKIIPFPEKLDTVDISVVSGFRFDFIFDVRGSISGVNVWTYGMDGSAEFRKECVGSIRKAADFIAMIADAVGQQT